MNDDKELKNVINNLFFCCLWKEKYDRKKNNLRESGYIVDRPNNYQNDLFGSIKSHGFWDVKVYYKYGITYNLEEDDTYSISCDGYVLPEALKQDEKRRKIKKLRKKKDLI